MASTRWEKIASSLRQSIQKGELRPGDGIPSEFALAEQFKVSRMTARRAVMELQYEGLVSRRRGRGTIVKEPTSSRAGVVGLLFPHKADMFEFGYLVGIRQSLPDDFQLIFHSVEESPALEAEYLERLRNDADGIIVFPTGEPVSVPIMKEIIASGYPLICIDRVPDGLETDAVVTDNYNAVLNGMNWLIQKGHKRIACISRKNPRISVNRERIDAYVAGMKNAGCDDPSRYMRLLPPTSDWEYTSTATKDALFRMMKEPDPPTAVFTPMDFFLAAVLEGCDYLGLSVPNDLEILSICDYPEWTLRNASNINRIVQDTHRVGEIAVEILQRRLRGEYFPKEIVRVPAHFHPVE